MSIGSKTITILIFSVAVLGEAFSLEGSDGLDMSSSEWLLFPAQDESSVETKIAKYIKKKRGVQAEVKFIDEAMSNLAIYYPSGGGEIPRIKVRINSQSAAKVDGKITERVVFVSAWYVMPTASKKPEVRRKILEVNNQYMTKYWIPDHITLDSDGDIQLQTMINISDQKAPVHCEAVLDSIMRLANGWQTYYKLLDEAIGLSKMSSG